MDNHLMQNTQADFTWKQNESIKMNVFQSGKSKLLWNFLKMVINTYQLDGWSSQIQMWKRIKENLIVDEKEIYRLVQIILHQNNI